MSLACVFTYSQDVASLTTYFQSSCGISPEEKQLSISGKNWGEVDLNGWICAFCFSTLAPLIFLCLTYVFFLIFVNEF